MRKTVRWIKKNMVLCIALTAAVITAFIVPPDGQYLSYFDWKTLTCLFCVLAVVCALKNISFFYIIACKVVELCRNAKVCILVLVYITFIGSMLIANDMALLTFLPLGLLVLTSTGMEKYMPFTFIMQNIAANLGGMLTPFGNPQNLYLYSYFDIPTGTFMRIMFPPFIFAVILITICCLVFVRPEALILKGKPVRLNPARTVIYLLLFAFSIIIVFRIIPYWTGLIVIPAALLCLDRKALAMVDYPLLGTFAAFFVFSGNMSRIPAVRELFSFLLGKSTLLFSALSCQVISNVPSAILMSRFTTDYPNLLVGVNLGGCGTLIASLASLITYREYKKYHDYQYMAYDRMPGQEGMVPGTGGYIARFSAFNFGFLALMLGFMFMLGSAGLLNY